MVRPCALCLQERELRQSHAIPKTFIRTILAANSGSAILIPTGPGKIRRGNDTLHGLLLCDECEKFTNVQIDAPGIRALKELKRRADTGTSIRLDYPADAMARFLTSVLWRAVQIPNYTPVKLTARMLETLRQVVLHAKPSPLTFMSIRLGRLSDRTEGFNGKSLAHFIFPPMPHPLGRQQAITMAMHGVVVEFTIPRVRAATLMHPGYLKKGSPAIALPDYDIFVSAPILQALVAGYDKHMRGDTTLERLSRKKPPRVA
jgi:hypothetical protein